MGESTRREIKEYSGEIRLIEAQNRIKATYLSNLRKTTLREANLHRRKWRQNRENNNITLGYSAEGFLPYDDRVPRWFLAWNTPVVT